MVAMRIVQAPLYMPIWEGTAKTKNHKMNCAFSQNRSRNKKTKKKTCKTNMQGHYKDKKNTVYNS